MAFSPLVASSNPLAQKILSGEFGAGDTIQAAAEGGKLVFRKSAGG